MEETSKDRSKISKQYAAILAGHGVPRSLAIAPRLQPQFLASMLGSIEPNPDTGRKGVSVKKQRAMLARCLKDPLDGPYTLCISADRNDRLPMLVALSLFERAMQQRSAEIEPRWFVVKQGFEEAEEFKRRLSLIVISNVFHNSTPLKLEKARDLLAEHDHLPCVLVAAGGDPLRFADGVLNKKVDRVLYFSNNGGSLDGEE